MKLIILLLVTLSISLQLQARTWTNSKGQKIVADIITATDTKVTLSLKKNKKKYTLNRADLIESDQEFIRNWLVEKKDMLAAEEEERKKNIEAQKESIMTFGDTKLVPERVHQITITIDKSRYPKVKKFNSDTYKMGIAIPKNFDPLNKVYTVVHISVPGKGNPCGALGAYMSLVKQADCVLIAADSVNYGTSLPLIDLYLNMDKKWDAKAKKWPMAFYGFSGGAKASAYMMAQAAKWDRNIIGAYMSGCNEDRTGKVMKLYKLKSAQKKAFKLAAIWLSSGSTDKVATPAHHKSVKSSMKSNRMKYIHIETFTGGHKIHQADQVKALKWMKEQTR